MFKNFIPYILLFYITCSFIVPNDNQIICSICEKQIKDKQYYVDIWDNPFHIYHKKVGTFCECCSRIISQKITNGGYILNDGRHICSLCDVSIIRTSEEVTNSFKYVNSILKKNGIDNIDINEIKIALIDKIQMKEYYGPYKVDHLHGMTKIEPINKEPFKIYILNNLPKTQFEAILAHELLHIWLYKKNIFLDNLTMEGFCNLGSYIIYSLDDTRFSKIHLMSLENEDKNPEAYKYKILKSMLEKENFRYILKNIKNISIP